jgi:hypothetical protein
MSSARPMVTADRQAHYVRQNGRLGRTERQRRRIRKTDNRLKRGRCCTSLLYWPLVNETGGGVAETGART